VEVSALHFMPAQAAMISPKNSSFHPDTKKVCITPTRTKPHEHPNNPNTPKTKNQTSSYYYRKILEYIALEQRPLSTRNLGKPKIMKSNQNP